MQLQTDNVKQTKLKLNVKSLEISQNKVLISRRILLFKDKNISKHHVPVFLLLFIDFYFGNYVLYIKIDIDVYYRKLLRISAYRLTIRKFLVALIGLTPS